MLADITLPESASCTDLRAILTPLARHAAITLGTAFRISPNDKHALRIRGRRFGDFHKPRRAGPAKLGPRKSKPGIIARPISS